MKVRELIEELQQLDPEYEVVMSKDGEGNGFSPYSGHCIGMYIPETTWRGEFHSDKLEYEEWFDDDEIDPYVENAIVLWPIN